MGWVSAVTTEALAQHPGVRVRGRGLSGTIVCYNKSIE